MFTILQYSAFCQSYTGTSLACSCCPGHRLSALNMHYLISQMLCFPNTWAFHPRRLATGALLMGDGWETHWQQAA